MKLTRTLFLSVLAPAVVFLLVANQVAFGLGGFDQPKGGLVAVLSVPGLLVGWGSLAFLVPVLIWLVLDWWGATATGLAIKCLGAATLALALGAVFGLFGGIAFGGHLGTSLAQLLEAALGRVPAIAMLVLMGIPGAVLAGAGFLELRGGSSASATRARESRSKQSRSKQAKRDSAPARDDKPSSDPILPRVARLFSGFGKPKKRVSNLADLVRGDTPAPTRNDGEAWYPERRFDDQGNELPMEFGRARDVGGIRFTGSDAEEESGVPVADLSDADALVVDLTDADTLVVDLTDADALVVDLTDADALVVDLTDADAPVGSALAEAIQQASDEEVSDGLTDELASEVPAGDETQAAVTQEEATVTTPPTATEMPTTPLLPTIPELFAEPEAEVRLEETAPAEAPESERDAPAATQDRDTLGPLVGSRDRAAENRLPSGVRWADEPTPPSRQLWAADQELDGTTAEDESADSDLEASDPTREGATGEQDEQVDGPGYALTDQGLTLREQLPAGAEALGESLSQRASPVDPDDIVDTPTVRDSVLQALGGDAQSKSSKRYLEKLEASGIFDFMDDGRSATKDSPAAESPETSRGAQYPKKAAPKKAASKAPASKKAAKKPAAKKQDSASQPAAQKPAAKKKAAAPKKTSSNKPAQSKKSATRPPAKGAKTRAPAAKRSEPKPKLAVSAPRKQTTTRPWKSGDWDPTKQIKQPPQALLSGTQREQLLRAIGDPTFRQAVDVAVQRGAAAPMLFTRRLGVRPYEARVLVQRLVETGVLDVAGANGAHPARLTPEHLAELLGA